ncbi:MAG: MerR family transcriptional regulator, partial [Chloroflexota bacterium]
PSQRTEAGHRLYAEREVARFQQITSLRQLGFSLEEIRAFLAQPDRCPRRVIELHVRRLREQIVALRRLCERLEALNTHLHAAGDVSIDELLLTIEEMIRVEKYYTPEQLEELRQRADTLGEEHIRQVEAEWPTLIEKVRAEKDKGTPPSSEPVQRLVRRWMELVHEFTGGHPEIEKAVGRIWNDEQNVHGVDTRAMRELFEYVSKALAAPKGDVG